MTRSAHAIAGGFLSLMVAMGIGRFAYTPLIPVMAVEWGLDPQNAGLLASINYIGYLIGAFAAGRIAGGGRIVRVAVAGLLLSAFTTAAMATSTSFPILAGFRFVSGLASAFAFVATTGIVLGVLAAEGRETVAGLFYGGVGTGIAFSGILVPPVALYVGAGGTWIVLGLLSLLLAVPTGKLLASSAASLSTSAQSTGPIPRAGLLFFVLAAAYGLEGFGYIITGTFMVAASKAIAGPGGAAAAWIVAGIAAAPSAFAWSWAGRRFGQLRSLLTCYVLQAIGVALPVFVHGAAGVCVGAFLFGATFMGIVTLALSVGCSLLPAARPRVVAFLTGIYGIGQVVGPTVAGTVVARTGNYDPALLVAAVAVMAGGLLVFLLDVVRNKG